MLRCARLKLHKYGMLNGTSIYAPRPRGVYNTDQMEFRTRGAHRGVFRDPTRTTKLGHVFIKQCPNCMRVRHVFLKERHHFHMCCESFLMKERMSVRKAIGLQQNLTSVLRKFDFDLERPHSNPHKKRPKGRSHHS